MTYFNWDEIFMLSRKDVSAIICLLYAQTSKYHEFSAKTMLHRLRLNHIPRHIFNKDCFEMTRTGLHCYYRTEDPQSYVRNVEFLFYSIPARKKAVYIKALSMRRMSEDHNYIPKTYFPNITENPLVKITDDRIYFPLENL